VRGLSEWRILIGASTNGLVRLRQSTFARQAAWLFVLNLISKGVGVFGSAYAARCLGPTNLGISGLVLATARPVMLTYDGGFNVVGVRKIAADKENSRSIIETINTFQLGMALIASAFWMILVFWLVPVNQRLVWGLGMPSLIFSATSIVFVFQGLEKLPIQTAIGTVSSLLIAGAYFLFFSPGMFLGADLIVGSAVGLLGALAAWVVYYRLFGRLPIGTIRLRELLDLLGESWRYWLLAVVVFFYTMFQIPLIAYLLGPTEVGIFRSALVLAAGVGLLFDSINSLLLARLVNWQKMGLDVMWHRQGTLLLVFLIIGVPISGVSILVAPVFYSLFLGNAFKAGILVFQILVVGRLVVFLGQIYAWGLVAAGQDNQFLGASVLGAVTSITMSVLLIPTFGLLGAACVSVVSEVLVHTYCYLAVRAKVRNRR
jgi:O-antigen/teichoic acid export membrane protein